MYPHPLHVIALGASTPLGRDAWSTAAAVRAGVSGFAQHPYMIDGAGEPMRAAMAPWLDIDLRGTQRLEALLTPAIDQALEPLATQPLPGLRLALSLGLPAPRPGLPATLQADLVRAIAARYPQRFGAVASFPAGHAAGLLALDAAAKKIAQGAFDACVVAGVDSYIEPETLEWLEACDQLHGAGPLNNAWGFIPGEAAGSLLLVRGELTEQLGLAPLARLVGIGTAIESKRIKTETVCIGEGLTEAIRLAALSLSGGSRVTDICCDMNGEPYRADEYGFSCLRTKEHFESASDFMAPADCWGDVAAASGPLSIALLCIAASKAYSRGVVGMAWASSEGGERAAAILELRRAG